jgi:SET domain-containing protein
MTSNKKTIVLPKFELPPLYYNNTELKLNVKPSHISGAGNGIFSYEKIIKKDQRIGFYEGKLIKANGDDVGDYSFTLTKCWYLDAVKYPRAYIAMINDAHNSKFNNNCEFVVLSKDKDGNVLRGKNQRIYLQAIRDIYMGEELYASYGEEYWNCTSREHI